MKNFVKIKLLIVIIWSGSSFSQKMTGQYSPFLGGQHERFFQCNRDHRHEWFEPLFTGLSFEDQWKKLEELFKTK